jgi:fructose-1,6-bisphosphatase/inositol monophosphatase family enzyme
MPDSDLQFAIHLARRAGEVMKSHLGAPAEMKADGTPVTRIDRQINAMVGDAVLARGDLVLGEEDAHHTGATAGRLWVCDPIDGTWLYAAGVPGSVFSLALVDDGVPVLGVVNDPWTGRLIHARAGQGAFVDGQRTTVNAAADVAGACLVLMGRRVPALDTVRLVAQALEADAAVVSSGSAVHDAVMVALGFAAGTVYPYSSPWDMAAAAVIVTEAGGRISDLDGAAQRYDGPINGAVISNGRVHDQLVRMVAAASDGGQDDADPDIQ